MGGKQCKPVVEFSDCVAYIPEHEMAVLDAQYRRLARVFERSKGKIPKETFMDECIAPRMAEFGPLVRERMFQVLDTDGSADINWQEFVCAMYMFLFSTREERLRLVFNLYDLAGSGQVGKKELKKMEVVMMQPSDSTDKDFKLKPFAALTDLFAYAAMDHYDKNNDNQLNYSEWRRMAEDDELIQDLVSSLRSISHDEVDIEKVKHETGISSSSGSRKAKDSRLSKSNSRTSKGKAAATAAAATAATREAQNNIPVAPAVEVQKNPTRLKKL